MVQVPDPQRQGQEAFRASTETPIPGLPQAPKAQALQPQAQPQAPEVGAQISQESSEESRTSPEGQAGAPGSEDPYGAAMTWLESATPQPYQPAVPPEVTAHLYGVTSPLADVGEFRRRQPEDPNRIAREFVTVAGQRALVESMGGDPDKEIGLVGHYGPEVRSMVEANYQAKIQQEVDFLLNDPDVVEARSLQDQLVSMSKEANRAFYDWYNREGATASMQEIQAKYMELFEAIQIPDEVRSRYSQLARSITGKLKQIDPRLTSYSHPELTGIFKTLLGVSGVQPSYIEDGVAGPMYRVPGGEEGLLGFAAEAQATAALGVEAAGESLINLPINGMKGAWNAFAWMKGAATNNWDTPEFPLEALIPKDMVWDPESKSMVAVDAPITLPMLWHGTAAAMGAETAEEALRNSDDASATLRWLRQRDTPLAKKVIDQAAMFTGSLVGFTKVAGAPLGWGSKIGEKIGLGAAKIVTGAKGAEAVAKAMKAAGAFGNVSGGALAFGGFEALTQNAKTPEEMWAHFGTGVRNGLVFHYLGLAHGKASRYLMGKKIPKAMAEPMGAALAGTGFGLLELGTGEGMPFADTDIAGSLHNFVKDPKQSTWEHYAEVMGKNILGMMLHSSLFGRHAAQINAEIVRAQQAEKAEKAEKVNAEVAVEKHRQLTEYVAVGEEATTKPEFGKPGLVQRLTDLTRRRAKLRQASPEAYEQREIGAVFARPLKGGRVFGAVGRGVRAGGKPGVSMEALEGRLEETLGQELGRGVATRLMSDLRTGGRFASVHTHEVRLSFSGKDIDFAKRMFERGGREPQVLVTPDTVEILLPREGARAPENYREIMENEISDQMEAYDALPELVQQAVNKLRSGEPVSPEGRKEAEGFWESERQAVTDLAGRLGMDHVVMAPAEGARAFEAWAETGDLRAFRRALPVAPEAAPVAQRLETDVRVQPEFDVDPGAAREVREALAEEGSDAAWRELEILVGPSVENVPHTDANLQRVIADIEGTEHGQPPLKRWETGSAARAAIEARDIADLSAPETPETALEARQSEQGIMDSLTPERKAERKSLKGWLKTALTFGRNVDFHKDVGYMRKFRGADLEVLVTSFNRLKNLGRKTHGLVAREMANIFEPLRGKEGTRKERLAATEENVKQLEVYGGLKDLTENYLQKRYVENPETGELELKEIPSKLPGGYSIDKYKAALERMDGELKPEVREAYNRAREVLDRAWVEFAATKGFDPSRRQKSFWPRQVKDFVDLKHMGQGKAKGGPRDPFRSYGKSRTGTERATEFSVDGLQAYLVKMRYDNATQDWLRHIGAGIMHRAEKETGVSFEEMSLMTAKEWRNFYDTQLQPRGFRSADFRTGEKGRVQFERSDDALQAYEALRMQLPDMPSVGRRIRPDGRNRFLVTDQALELMLQEKQRTAFTSPFWRKTTRIIGEWFKLPALRGPLGIATPARQFRNTISDLKKIWEHDSLKSLLGTAKQMLPARRILKKVQKNQELTPDEHSLWDEFNYFGTGGKGEFTDIRIENDVPIMERYDPSMRTVWQKILAAVRGDMKWAENMDQFYENWVRFAYFMGERMDSKVELSSYDNANRLVPDQSQLELLRKLHLNGARTLVNYDHLTPFEATAMNGVLVPFYTWARHNLTGTLQAFKEKPGWTAAKVAGPALAMHLFNLAVFGDDEERLVDKWPGIASRPHLHTGIKDALGNPLVLWFQTPSAEGLGMLGIDTLVGQAIPTALAIAEGEPGAAWQRIARGWFDSTKQAAQRMVNPLLMYALQRDYQSKFMGAPQVNMGDLEAGIGRISPTLGHVAAMGDILSEVMGEPGGTRPDKTALQRAARYAPFLSFIDISQGLPWSAQTEEFVIGQAQSEEQRMSARYRRYSRLLYRSVKAGNMDRARSIFAAAWGDIEPMATRYGLTQQHIVARMWESAQREARKERLRELGLAPKRATLTRRQAAMLYERIAR